MKKLNIDAISKQSGCNYQPPFNTPCLGSTWHRLGGAAGLTAFGVNLSRIPPGVWSSQRHWHAKEDEFVYVVSGELVLITDAGEEILRAGDCAAFPKNDGNGHHLVNRSSVDAVCLEIGTRSGGDHVVYPDIDLLVDPTKGYTHKDGTVYQP